MLLLGNGVPVHKVRTDVAGSNSCIQVQLGSERVPWVLFPLQMRQHATGVDEYCMTANRALERHASLLELVAKVLDLADTVPLPVHVESLLEANGQRFQVATCQSPVGKVALKGDDVALDLLS